MFYISNAITAAINGSIKAADWVEDHPWLTLGIIAGLTVLGILF